MDYKGMREKNSLNCRLSCGWLKKWWCYLGFAIGPLEARSPTLHESNVVTSEEQRLDNSLRQIIALFGGDLGAKEI